MRRSMRYVVIGGGVSGVCCVQELRKIADSDDVVTLVTASETVKKVKTVAQYTRNIEELEVEDLPAEDLKSQGIRVVQGLAEGLDVQNKALLLDGGRREQYDRLCLCVGARPKAAATGPHVHLVRDLQSVHGLAEQLQKAYRVMVVGNGAIALELVSSLHGVQVIWSLRHGHIGDAFFDLDAAEFLLTEMTSSPQAALEANSGSASGGRTSGAVAGRGDKEGSVRGGRHHLHEQVQQQGQGLADMRQHGSSGNLQGGMLAGLYLSEEGRGKEGGGMVEDPILRSCGSQASLASSAEVEPYSPSVVMRKGHRLEQRQPFGHAVGPQWTRHLPQGDGSSSRSQLVMEYGTTLERVEPSLPGSEFPATAILSNGARYGVDLVVSAIGVTPNTEWLQGTPVALSQKDGGVLVDRSMRSSVPDVYAAGDCCTVDWGEAEAPHWFQMRLWMQARAMGQYSAQCMAGTADDLAIGFNFELFTHVTRFCGKKVVLLGLYNGQKLDNEPDNDVVTYTRASEGAGATFVRVLLLRGRMQGAVLIGETELEETFENLILDGLDLSTYGPALLDPRVELDHMFD